MCYLVIYILMTHVAFSLTDLPSWITTDGTDSEFEYEDSPVKKESKG